MLTKTVSPTHTYVMLCYKHSYSGIYVQKFVLPEKYENDSDKASWYYMNRLDLTSAVAGCIAFEDYSNITDVEI